jgi:dephospho-CoA kinase
MPIKKHMVYGVTGYIGSGKTFLCNELQKIAQEQDIALHIIQVDEIRRSISDTSIERIRGIIQQQLEKSEGIILLERAMLIPDQMQDLVHSMIFVSCSPEIQKERLKNGDL